MSKIRIDVDTKEKTLKVVKDGEELTNVDYISISNANEYHSFYCAISMTEKEEEGMYKYTSLTAKQMFDAIKGYEDECEANK